MSPSNSIHTAHTGHNNNDAVTTTSFGGGTFSGSGRGLLQGNRGGRGGGGGSSWGTRGMLGGFSPLPAMGLTPGGGQAMTPISNAMASVNWLQQLTGRVSEEVGAFQKNQ